jgi:hypothetical protein
LRYRSATKARRTADDIPEFEVDRSLLTRAILEGGARWEQRILSERLGDAVAVAATKDRFGEARHTADATIAWLEHAHPGEYLYQGTLRAPNALYDHYAINPELVVITDCYPDLITAVDGGAGVEFRVIDAKASDMMKLSHRIQVGLYSLLLDAALDDAGLAPRCQTSRLGGVWLYEQAEPEWFELARIEGQLQAFLTHDLGRILNLPANEAPWHLYFRCEWCDYYEHCRSEAEARRDVSLVPYLSTFAKRHLAERSVTTVDELATLLAQPDADSQLIGCASLEGRAAQLRTSVVALVDDATLERGAHSVSMPKGEHVLIAITLQSEPLEGRVYAYAINRLKGKDLYGSGADTVVRVAPDPRPDTLGDLRRNLVRDLHALLGTVDAYNRTHSEWTDQKSVQVFVFDGYERTLLVDTLLDAILDPVVAEAALALLFHFQQPELAQADDHPATEVFFPVVVVIDVLRSLFALPVPVVYRFADVVAALQPSEYGFEYRGSDYFNFALSNRLKSNAIFEVWERDRADILPNIENELKRRVWATTSVISGLRERLDGSDALFAWPPKFRFPAGFGFTDPVLSRLAFITRYEAILGCLQVRTPRSASVDERRAQGVTVDLVHLDGDRWAVEHDQLELSRLEPDTFTNFLVTPDTTAGRRARVAFDDFAYRQRQYGPKNADLAIAAVVGVESDRVRLKLTKTPAFTAPIQGAHYVLDRRWTDWLSDRVITDLGALDGDPQRFTSLLLDPVATRHTLDVSPELRDTALALIDNHGATVSQRHAFEGVLDHDVQVVWGPPGTGKTHFLALAILALAESHRKAGRPLRVVLSAFTNAAIDNLLAKVESMQRERTIVRGGLALFRVGHELAGCKNLDRDSIVGAAKRHDLVVIGTTVWQLHRADPAEFRADLIVIDEGSQLTVAQAAIAWRRVAPGGRFVVAGDPEQLPPIVAGDYPANPGEPPLHRSILECLRHGDPAGDRGFVRPLLENFRMNAPLCAYPAATIYPDDYRPATSAIGEARLRFDPGRIGRGDVTLLRQVLDPQYPLVVCVFEDVQATRENPAEADLAAQIAAALRDQSNADDARFWRDELFVVSPHHAQGRLLRRTIGEATGTARPFVDTVDKMQGQECDTVIVSYGVSDVEYALGEKEFIYQRNRLNVSITRARHKTIVLISRRLLDPPIQALEHDEVADGISYMQGLVWHCQEHGDTNTTTFGKERLTVYRR